MKAIQVTIDEELLRTLDRDPLVRREGRSAVFRTVLREWLKRRRRAAIGEAYRKGYAGDAADLEGWAGAGTWPEE
jgi:metal-responsive CopG/Arc/MetJ family transcriptional regulator